MATQSSMSDRKVHGDSNQTAVQINPPFGWFYLKHPLFLGGICDALRLKRVIAVCWR
jgi:hypothetical protein